MLVIIGLNKREVRREKLNLRTFYILLKKN